MLDAKEKDDAMDLVSVIIPVYNVSRFLDQCLESVVTQDYPNMEIILVDDGSTDDSGEKCDTWAGRDFRIRVIHQANQGLSGARNSALDVCRGDYIIPLDSDDYWAPGIVGYVHEQMVKVDADLAIFKNRKFVDGEQADPIIIDNSADFSPFEKTNAYRRMYAPDQDFITLAHNKMYRRCLFDEIRYPLGKRYEDAFVSHLILARARRIIKSEEPLYYYRKRQDSIMGRAQQNDMCDLQLLEYRRDRNAFFASMNNPELLKCSYADYFFWLIRLSKAFGKRGQKGVSDSLYLEFKKSCSEVKGKVSFEGKRILKYRLFYWFRI